MAITTAKVTYSLKPETVDRVQELSVRWGVPKSEVIRRAVDRIATEVGTRPRKTPLEALDWLQKHPIPAQAVKKWKADIRRWRKGWNRRGK